MSVGWVAVDRKERLKIPPQPIPKQAPELRIQNWEEVCLGFDLAAARLEANRCIQCPAAPCVKACPLHNDIPGALLKIEQGDPLAGAGIFRLTSPMPEVCGRLCPQDRLCEGSCVVGKKSRPVAIGRLEAFAADFARVHETGAGTAPTLARGRRVAVVGAGPAGLAVAERLAVRGHVVTVLDAWPKPGGLLLYGIPRFKLAKGRVDDLVERLVRLGVEFRSGIRVGAEVTVDSLFEQGFDAVFLGHGAAEGNRLRVPGEDLELQAPDASGRARPVPVPGSETEIVADTLVVAIGYRVEESLVEATPGVETTRLGTVVVAEDGATARPGVFAAGDCVRGADLVVTAVADARRAADAIDRYLKIT